ncbi:hypothetical protein ABL78_6874 [Leptomonas seymouri]|uniref:Uncharacterized protein n=1 Tax=Leptomonas seymouri TaxID=5684 RepID=A0A0N1IIG4_LEPSE|nr:hypothetical protein ABL78_6874 [Leptomonas seymouri]|eukprot:KPI84071.1 hypothetical protein ABL78_6874 [Leptomonas seymouri]
MHTSYAGVGVSDGTFTQALHVHRPPMAPQLPSIALQQLLCDEMEDRTRLICDALTAFQWIVGLCVAERFGERASTMAPPTHTGSVWRCPRCGSTQQYIESSVGASPSNGHGGVAHKVRAYFSQSNCRTPLCSMEELCATSNRCMYAADASVSLEKRYAFQQEFGSLLQRISAASRGIQDTVTR